MVVECCVAGVGDLVANVNASFRVHVQRCFRAALLRIAVVHGQCNSQIDRSVLITTANRVAVARDDAAYLEKSVRFKGAGDWLAVHKAGGDVGPVSTSSAPPVGGIAPTRVLTQDEGRREWIVEGYGPSQQSVAQLQRDPVAAWAQHARSWQRNAYLQGPVLGGGDTVVGAHRRLSGLAVCVRVHANIH